MRKHSNSAPLCTERSADYKIRSTNLGLLTVINFLKIGSGFLIPYLCSGVLLRLLSFWPSFFNCSSRVQLKAIDGFLAELIPFWFNFMYLYRDLRTHSTTRSRVLLILHSLILNAVVECSGNWALPLALRPLYKIFMIFKLTSVWGPELYRVQAILIGLKFLVGPLIGPGRENKVYTKFNSPIQILSIILLAGVMYYINNRVKESTFVVGNLACTLFLYTITLDNPGHPARVVLHHLQLWIIIYLLRKFLLWSTEYSKIYHAQQQQQQDVSSTPIPPGVWNEFKYFKMDMLTICGLGLLILEGLLTNRYNPNHLKILSLRVRIRQTIINSFTLRGNSRLTLTMAPILATIVMSAIGGCVSNSVQSYITSSLFVKKVLWLDPTERISPAISHSLKVDYRYLSNSNRISHLCGFNRTHICPANPISCALIFTLDLFLELFSTELILLRCSLNF